MAAEVLRLNIFTLFNCGSSYRLLCSKSATSYSTDTLPVLKTRSLFSLNRAAGIKNERTVLYWHKHKNYFDTKYKRCKNYFGALPLSLHPWHPCTSSKLHPTCSTP